MSQQDYLQTIQSQQSEIMQLREQLARASSSGFEQKYKKALKQISGIIKANRQLKAEIDKLSNFKNAENANFNKINEQELGKAYESMLKEKGRILQEKEALQIENQKLKYTVASLSENVERLKADKMALAREKEGASLLNFGQRIQSSTDRARDRETELRKTLENYQQRDASLARANRKLEEQVSQLQNKLFTVEQEYKNKLNDKDIELKVCRSSVREQFQTQIASFKREISQLKSVNNQLTVRVNFYSQEQQNFKAGHNEYEEQLIETLRQLKIQIEPMSSQIGELKEKNQIEREQSQRRVANLQIKIMEYEAQIERLRQSYKTMEQKLLKESEKARKWDESERSIRKLEEENRMLGGRVIVLEAKEVALRNRSGDELQQRVLQFQTRVQMLLNEKDTIPSLKNVGIHQLVALKAYILELDARLKQVVNQNEYATKKYKSYKEKCSQLIKQLKQHDIAINALKGKLQGYDRLVVKLQGELERAININDSEMKAINVKISQSSVNSVEVYKKRYESLLEKLSLQQKYAQQEIQTIKLNYDTKLLDLNIKLEELNSIKQTIGLYKSKNEELSHKLTQKQNQLLQTKMSKIISDPLPQPKPLTKDNMSRLNESISSKEAIILNLETQLKRIQQEWRGRYERLEQTTSTEISRKSRQEQERRKEIENLEQELRKYRNKLSEIEIKSTSYGFKTEELPNKYQNNNKIIELQIELENFRSKYEFEASKISNLQKINSELKQQNSDYELELSKVKYEIRRIEKQFEMQLQEKQNELRRLRNRPSDNEFKPLVPQTDSFKVNPLKMEIQLLENKAEQSERERVKCYNRVIELEREVSELTEQITTLRFSVEREKNSVNNDLIYKQSQKDSEIERLNVQIRSFRERNAEFEDRISEQENEIIRLRSQLARQRQRLSTEVDSKDDEISRLNRQLNRIRVDTTNQEQIKDSIRQEFEYKISRFNTENLQLKDQIETFENEVQRYTSQIRFLKNRELEYNSKVQGHEQFTSRLNSQIKIMQNKEIELQNTIMDKEATISKLASELSFIRNELSGIEVNIDNKDATITRLNAELNTLRNQQMQWELQYGTRDGEIKKVTNQLAYAKNRIEELQLEADSARGEVIRLKSQFSYTEQNYLSQTEQITQSQATIFRLQSEIRTKNEQITELNQEIHDKSQKLPQLQLEINRLRASATETQEEIISKDQQISRLNYELTSVRNKYEALSQQHESQDNNWMNLNRQLITIRTQINSYEDDLSLKDVAIERYKNDIRDLTQQVEGLHEEIYTKNTTINNLNQEIFRLKMSADEQSNQKVVRLQREVSLLKSQVSSLETELDLKQGQLSRAKMQISSHRSNVTANRYSDQEYDTLQGQFYQLQRTYNQLRGQVTDKDMEIEQLTSRLQFLSKKELEARNRYSQQRQDLEQELENVLARERSLKIQLTSMENDVFDSRNNQDQIGIQMYQSQCDRLTRITEQLQEEVNSLKIKLTAMTNQEDRIVENLTIMTLTFAEVEALRDRIKAKENQISEVRKSLINFASSSEEITSRRILDAANTIISRQNLFLSESNKEIPAQIQNIGQSPNVAQKIHEAINANQTSYELHSQNSSLRQSNFDEQQHQEGYNYEIKRSTGQGFNYQSSYAAGQQGHILGASIQADRRLQQLASSVTGQKEEQISSSHVTVEHTYNSQVNQQISSLTSSNQMSWRYGNPSAPGIPVQPIKNPGSPIPIIQAQPALAANPGPRLSQQQIKVSFGSAQSLGSNQLIQGSQNLIGYQNVIPVLQQQPQQPQIVFQNRPVQPGYAR